MNTSYNLCFILAYTYSTSILLFSNHVETPVSLSSRLDSFLSLGGISDFDMLIERYKGMGQEVPGQRVMNADM